MGRSLSDLAVSMRKRADELPMLANTVAKEGAEAMLREMIEVTPVDTSEAISNWQIGIGTRPIGQLPPHVTGSKGSSRSASSQQSLDEGLATLGLKTPGQSIFLSNTAKHIVDLNRGTSTQFAGGFVPRALIVFRLAARATAKRLLK